jgi:hypothetical protein
MANQRTYKRKFKGLIRKAKYRDSAIKYPKFKLGDKVNVVDDILDIDARITGNAGGFVGEQVRRRQRYAYLRYHSCKGKIVNIEVADFYVQFKVKDKKRAKELKLDKPVCLWKQMIKLR